MPSASPGSDGLAALLHDVEKEARREPFDVCRETYAEAARDAAVPLLLAGSLDAPWCAVGRELGRDEVLQGEPLVGMAGRRFRRAVHEALLGPAPRTERRFAHVLDHVLLTNLVPYRPVGNRAYSRAVRDRFRPYLERLLADLWSGERVLALGKDALLWFAPYTVDEGVDALWADPERRFRDTLRLRIRDRELTLAAVPHPSPLSPFRSELAAVVAGHLRAARG